MYLLSANVFLCLPLESFPLDIALTAVSITPGMQQIDCDSWIRWLWSVVEATLTSYEAAGKDIKHSERPTKRYDDDGHAKDVGLRVLLLCLLLILRRRERFPHKRTDVEWRRKGARDKRTGIPASCKDTELHFVL